MKNDQNLLSHYFETAKSQPSVISIDEIKELIQTVASPTSKVHSSKASFSSMHKLFVIGTSVASLMVASFWYALENLPVSKNESKLSNINPTEQNESVHTNPGETTGSTTSTIAQRGQVKSSSEENPGSSNSSTFILSNEQVAKNDAESLLDSPDNGSKPYLTVDPQTLNKLGAGVGAEGVKFHYYMDESAGSIASVTVKGNRHNRGSFKYTIQGRFKSTTKNAAGRDTTYFRAEAFHKKYLYYLKIENLLANKRIPTPIFASNIQGTFKTGKFRNFERKFDHTIDFSKLVPILVETNNADKDEALLWFEPTPAFLEVLPSNLAKESLAIINRRTPKEIEMLKSHERSMNREQYYRVTKVPGIKELNKPNSKILNGESPKSASASDIKLTNLIVYPNPTSEWLNLKVTMQEKQIAKIYLTNLNGQLVKVLQSSALLSADENLISFKVSELPSGMYVLILQLEKGKPLTKRIIIK
ncbi:T9SS type A sorting domain-containing protein [Adhaeribacter aquaticus]|uniref:T9SS type A sorting domain-containing protein n=1 Tax=Adhaeribacter aquaticus TaxID=299567 RepID=UPI000422C931|nr:T9SS type A sorting domain-containing protein [Adhaeribacter aquaticus]